MKAKFVKVFKIKIIRKINQSLHSPYQEEGYLVEDFKDEKSAMKFINKYIAEEYEKDDNFYYKIEEFYKLKK